MDKYWMRYAAELTASVTERQVSPNPRVGALVLNADGRLVGQGVHLQAGTPHAEAHALVAAGDQARGGTLVVTLEPCNHTGRMPPCTEAVISAGIKRVVFGMTDPNPRVAGQGLARLESEGISIAGPIMPEACAGLNPVFCHHIVHKTPFTAVKVATTLDGHMVDRLGNSQWITGEAARQHVHQQRSRFDALLTTAQTVLADNSRLTVRTPAADSTPPTRVVLDRNGRLLTTDKPLAIMDTATVPTWVVTTDTHQAGFAARYPDVKTLVLRVDRSSDLQSIWQLLYRHSIISLWVEAGPQFTSALLADQGLVQQLWWYRAGLLLGTGKPAITWEPGQLLTTADRWITRHTQSFPPDDLLTVYTTTGA